MLQVNVPKHALIQILDKNRESHRATFLRAQEKYRERVIEEFENRLEGARENKPINTYFNFPVPADHTDDYDRAIGMLNMMGGVETSVSLSEEDYAKLVEDDWGWKKQWASTNASYGA
jgi:hypothetical protein